MSKIDKTKRRKLDVNGNTTTRALIEQKYEKLVEFHTNATRELRQGCANNNKFAAVEKYNYTNIEEPTEALLNAYQDYIDGLDNIEEKQKAAGHFLFLCKKSFYGWGWKAAKSFTDYITINSALKDEDKIHYLQYLLELINPQKDENKDKKRNNLHPIDLKGLRKLAEFQFIPTERENIEDIFTRVNNYLDHHSKYAPHIYDVSQSFANNLHTISTQDFFEFSKIYFKAMAKTVKNKKKNEKVQINLVVLNKLMAKEGNSKDAIEGFIKIFAEYYSKNTDKNNLNAYLCKSIGELIKNKTQGYSEAEQKELQQLWLNNCPLKKRWETNTEALSFLHQIGPEILMPKKNKKTNKQNKDIDIEDYMAIFDEPDETIKDKLWNIEKVIYPNASDYIDVNDYAKAESMVDTTITETINSMYYDVKTADNPKEKSWDIADAYNQLVNSSLKKNSILDQEMVNLFNTIIDNYDYTSEDVYILLQHINATPHERSKYVAVTIGKRYRESRPRQKTTLSTQKKASNNPIMKNPNQLELSL